MSTESLPDHVMRPHIRPIQPIPVSKDGKQFVALRDPSGLSPHTMVVPVPVMQVLQHFRGERSVQQIAETLNANVSQFIELAKGLDQVGLLWGPTFERLEDELRQRIQAAGSFPMRASQTLGKDETTCRAALEKFFQQTEDPEIEGEPIGIVAPHLDYQRGWPNYAAAYYGLRHLPPPERVVILGTNHFGAGDGVALTEFGFTSPMGTCPADQPVIDKLIAELGTAVLIDQLDHMPEHSVELHLPWLQYCFGNVPIIAALIPDPLAQVHPEDGQQISPDRFTAALQRALGECGGRTLYVASSDLSHVGPQFGEPRAVDQQRRFDVERHDREMMAKFLSGDAEEFLAAMRWNKNPTRWCSIGNMATVLTLARPESVELIDYRQAYDDRGTAMVTSAAMALLGGE